MLDSKSQMEYAPPRHIASLFAAKGKADEAGFTLLKKLPKPRKPTPQRDLASIAARNWGKAACIALRPASMERLRAPKSALEMPNN